MSLKLRRVAISMALFGLGACGTTTTAEGPAGSESGSSSGATSDTGSDATTAGSESTDDGSGTTSNTSSNSESTTGNEPVGYPFEDCNLPEPCDPIETDLDVDGYLPRHICNLSAMRDKMVGRYQVDHPQSPGNEGSTYIAIGEGGEVLVQDRKVTDFKPMLGTMELCDLLDAAYFEACLADEDPDCISGAAPAWLENCHGSMSDCPG